MLQEFAVETGRKILIYQGLDFLKRANDLLESVTVTEDAIGEVESTIAERNRQFFHDLMSNLSSEEWSQLAQKQQQASLALNQAMTMIQDYDPSKWNLLSEALRERKINLEGISDAADALRRLCYFLEKNDSAD